MQISTWLNQATRSLSAVGIASARLDSLILLEDITGKDRAWLLAHTDFELTDAKTIILNTKVIQRKTHFPLAYIRGQSDFYGRTFYVNEQVLEPRPESETIISQLKNLAATKLRTVVDVGTGSGALAVTSKLEFPELKVIATDIDPNCLSVASRNAVNLQANINCVETDLLAGLLETIDIILANLPYVPEDFTINRAASHEPRLAIFGGADGLELYRRMFDQIDGLGTKPRYIITESLPFQHTKLAAIASASGYTEQAVADLVQVYKSA